MQKSKVAALGVGGIVPCKTFPNNRNDPLNEVPTPFSVNRVQIDALPLFVKKVQLGAFP